jgi:hypothetical protein
MSTVCNPEADIIPQIERMEMLARDLRHKLEHVHSAEDKRVLNQQLQEIEEGCQYLRKRIL